MKKTSLMVRCVLNAPAVVLFVVTAGAAQAELPVRDMTRFWSPNVRIAEQSTNYMRIVQDGASTNNWILNWQSFNISAGSRVQFDQPGGLNSNHIALNRVWSGSQSVINGQIDANGRIYLINQNGILFGSTSRINVNSLVASALALNISDDDFINNNVNLLNVIDNGGAAFINGAGAGMIEIEAGARIATDIGGNVLIIAPEVINGGDIVTSSGQVILAAATDSVYLTPSNDPALRGFLVEVGGVGGDVTNVGNILAGRGNITLAGLAINQNGILQATTSINENGSIRLLARDHATATSVSSLNDELVLGIDADQTDASGASTKRNEYYAATQSGEVTLGSNSQIDISPDNTDTSLVVDEQNVNVSRVEVTGHDVTLKSGASIVATGGDVLLHANSNPQQTALNSSGILSDDRHGDTSVIVMETGSRIDVSGTADTHVAMERNQLEIQLTGDFLRDAPLQREGELRNERVNIDIREGTPLGDISAEVAANVKRGVNERLSAGGNVELLSQGGVVMHQGSEVNITGGAVTYDPGYVSTSQLVTTQGQIVGIADASIDQTYSNLFGKLTIKSERWGKAGERRWSLFGGNKNSGVSRYYDSYTEGQDAGHFTIHAPAIAGMANIHAGSTVSPLARTSDNRASGGNLNIITHGQNIDVVSSAINPVMDDMNEWLLNGGNSLPDFALQLDDDVFNTGLTHVNITQDRNSDASFFGGSFDVNSDATLRMASGAILRVDSGAINVQGSINIDSGSVALNSSSMATVANTIDVSGSWVNDSPEQAADINTPVDVNGGSISINASNMNLTDNSKLIANGGGWLQANGKLDSGEGGDINLAVDHPTGEISELDMNGSMQAFGVNNARGGSLSITANRIHIAPETAASAPGLLQFTPEFFTQNGFADYKLTANKADMQVAAGSHITPRASNLALNANAVFQQSGTDIRNFSHEVVLPDYLRAATNLSLASNQNAVNNGVPAADSSLTIERGASITTDAGGKVKLSSSSRLLVAGDITAQAGDITMNLGGYSQQQNVVADQTLWLDGKLDVSGVFVADPQDDTGLRRGRTLDGGNINLSASNGFVMAGENSVMDVSGVSDAIDLPDNVSGNTVLNYSRQPVYGDAGHISITAAEGFVLAGDMNATAASATTSGGSLSLTLDAGSRVHVTEPGSYASSQFARQINLTQSESSLPDVVSGNSVPVTGDGNLIGQGWVAADSITAAGFDNLDINARFLATATGQFNGKLNLHDDINLSLRQSLTLNAPIITGNGNAVLDANYVFLGSRDKSTSLSGNVTATGGTGSLQIHADGLLDISGHVRTQGFDAVNLQSDGDIRVRGTDNRTGFTPFRLDGSLQVAGNLTLQADQIYATTLSEFDFAAVDVINILAGNHAAPVLSAGSVLSFNADVIRQAGVVKAPLGEIHFNASSELDLQAGSLTSVSAENQTIPFGEIKGQQIWYYGFDRASPEDLPNEQNAAPDKRISLNADVINMSEGAVFDIAGGGDLYAWEFVEGLGGSVDHLLPENSGNAFAVLPGFSGYAPYDPILWNGVNGINMGDQVYLEGSHELAAGLYTLLPARYALLPGAVLVTPAENNLVRGQTYQQLDGASVVAGQRRIANTTIHDEQWSGFIIENGDVVRSRSEYFEATASQFFRDTALRTNSALPTMPEDAGALDIVAANSLNLAGTLRGDAASVRYVDENEDVQYITGRSSQVNIAGNNLRVVNDYDANGGIQLLDDSLNEFGAASLLLGGTRHRTTEGTEVNVTANNVTIEDGSRLDIPSVILAASDNVTVESGAVINATGDAGKQDDVFIVEGDGALLRASNASQAKIIRQHESATPVQGTLTVVAGAQIVSGTSMILDSSFNTVVDGELLMNAGSLNIGARRISLGDVNGHPGGLVLDTADLGRLDVNELVLTSRSSVDLYGDLDLSFSSLGIEAAAINGYQQSGENVTLHADSFSIGNPGKASSATIPVGNGNLSIAAADINLSDGDIALRGFNDVQLHATNDIAVAGDGALEVSSVGNLTLDGRIAAKQRLADYSISNGGQISTRQTVVSSAARSEVLAASLTLNADHIDHQGVIDLASGNVHMHATNGDIEMADNSVINVSGIARDFAGDMRYSAGGNVELTADHGSVNQSGASEINVSGGGDHGAAGSVKAVATEGDVNFSGSLLAAHDVNVAGGHFVVDANNINQITELNQQLNNNGFDAQRHLRLRQGDVELAASETIHAQDVLLAADAGNITINGNINASGEKAGEVVLAARDNVTLTAGASIDVSATGDAKRGGHVLIETRQGQIDLAAGAEINVSGTSRGGQVHLRAPRNATNDGINIVSVASNMTGFERVDIEGFRVYNPGNVLNVSDFTTPYSQANTFMAHDVLAALNFSVALDEVHLRPGIEFDYAGNLSLSGDLDFLNQRYSNNDRVETGVLTVRTTGNLTVNGSVSDGILFEADPVYGIERDVLQTGDSWSYRFVAGADLNAAHVMTTAGNTADMILSANRKIRTGTGDIEIAAADDFIMNNGASIYSAGENTGRGTIAADAGEFVPDFAGLGPLLDLLYLPGIQFPEHGGDVRIVTGGDIQGNAVSYLSSDWLQRIDIENTLTTWGVDFQVFNQGIAAFGGGDVQVTAGGDVNQLALYAPVTGRQIGQINAQWDDGNGVMNYLPGTTNEVELLGGGDIALQAAGDITRLFVHADKGEVNVSAGGSVGNGSTDSGVYMLLADAQADVTAQGDIYLQGVSNSTLQPLSLRHESKLNDIGLSLQQNWFWTISEASALSMSSMGGDVLLRNNLNDGVKGQINSGDSVSSFRLNDYPASLSLLAMDGSVSLPGITIFPSAYGQLSLLAQNNVYGVTTESESALIDMLGYSADSFAGWQDPVLIKSVFNDWLRVLESTSVDNLLHINDSEPVKIVARQGDIAPLVEKKPLIFNLPKAVEMMAGRDIVAVNLHSQNLRDSDISLIEAGRDFRHINTALYGVSATRNEITVGGSGELQIIAGRNIDLGNSNGIKAVGNTENIALPETGADVLVMAGSDGADYNAFITSYFTAGSSYATDVITYMNTLGNSFLETQFEEALSGFYALDQSQQRGLVMKGFYHEIRQSIVRAANEQYNQLEEDDTTRYGYSRGMEAIATLFPETISNRREAVAGEETSGNVVVTGGYAYTVNTDTNQGDLSMVSSSIITSDTNSDISIMAPSGLLNVGLTVKDENKADNSTGIINFSDGDINIYTLGDIAVNQSRIQALNGGDLTIWSTFGDIDAGKGAKTQLSLPPAKLVIDYGQNHIYQKYSAVSQGSGVRVACFDVDCEPGSAYLASVAGVIDTGDAGIYLGGDGFISGEVVGPNLEIGGDSGGFSTDTAAMGLDLGNLSPAAGDSTAMVSGDDAADAFSNAAVAILQVEVMGLSDEEGSVSDKDR